MLISRSTTAAVSAFATFRSLSLWRFASLLFELGGQLEALEPIGPEAFEKFAQLAQSLRPGAVDAASSLAALVDQAGVPQDRQMLGDRRPCDLEARSDLSGTQLGVAKVSEDFATAGLGDCANC
jgi:hypothetical protein